MRMKKIYPALLLAGSLMLAGCMKASSIQLTIAPDQTPQTNQPVIIDVDTNPGLIKINPNSITISGGESWVEDGVIKFQASEPGDYTIKVNQNDVESNTLTISVAKADFSMKTSQAASSQKDSASSSRSSLSPSSSESGQQDLLKDAAKTVQEETINVDEAYQKADSLITDQTPVTITGQLPQTTIRDKAGNQVAVIWNNQVNEYIILDGFEIPFGGCPAQVSGTLTRNENGELVLNMTYITTDAIPQTGQGSQPDSSAASAESAQSSESKAWYE